MAIDLSFLPRQRQSICIYGQAGSGKSVALITLLKCLLANPKLKVRIFCLEDNSLPALILGFKIHGIEDLLEGQLVICTPPQGKVDSSIAFQDASSDAFYQSILKQIFTFSGIDIATGKQVSLGNISTWDEDTVLCLDGLTNFQYACSFRGKVKAIEGKNGNDARAVFYAGQTVLMQGIKQILGMTKCHFILLAHDTTSDEAAQAKYHGLKAIHPALGTRSIVSQFMGNFSYVFYSKRVEINNTYFWSLAEKGAYTRDSLDRDKCKELKLSLDKLPADFSHELYGFFN
jgi:hypothetical protein